MNESSNEMQTPYGDDTGREAQQRPSAGSTADQQEQVYATSVSLDADDNERRATGRGEYTLR